MQFVNRVRGLVEWYRALRSLNRILATLSLVLLFAAGCGSDDSNGPSDRSSLKVTNTADHSVWYVFVQDCAGAG
jgi:hypothetical protein